MDSRATLNVTTAKIRYQSRPSSQLPEVSNLIVCLIFMFGGLLSNSNNASANPEYDGAAEYAVKAAYIYNILRFVSWEEDDPLAGSETLNVCLYKDNPFNHYLDPIRNKSIGDKKIKLSTIEDVSQTSSCHLIFFGNNSDIEDLNEYIKQQSKLSDSIFLGNNIAFIKNGGLFGFYIENNKVRLGANRAAIADSRLHISSQLLEVCQLYGDAP